MALSLFTDRFHSPLPSLGGEQNRWLKWLLACPPAVMLKYLEAISAIPSVLSPPPRLERITERITEMAGSHSSPPLPSGGGGKWVAGSHFSNLFWFPPAWKWPPFKTIPYRYWYLGNTYISQYPYAKIKKPIFPPLHTPRAVLE